ncbi:MAG: NAD(P)/FAD-dependent oxidoreductase [Breznakibacter sp.]
MQHTIPIVIVGAGIASLSAIKAIREHDRQTPIVLISNEDRLPYKRTQVNKFLAKGFMTDEFAIHPSEYYQSEKVELRYGHVVRMDVADQTLVLADGSAIRYHKCLLALGHRHRTYTNPQISDDKIFTVYTAEQSEKLRRHTLTHRTYFVLGSGVEGVEIAEQLAKMDKKVYLVHRSKGLLHNEFSPVISEMIKATLERNGIECLEHDLEETGFQSDGAYVSLSHAEKIYYADAIVSCIGSEPRTELAQQAGLATDKGILADNCFNTSNANVYAAGNVAQLPQNSHCRLWHHAEAQGFCAGLNLIGRQCTYQSKPFRLKTELFNQFFYSHNYENVNADMQKRTERNNQIYRELYLDNGRIKAILMVNDKARAKTYQEAVWNSWTIDEIRSKLPL